MARLAHEPELTQTVFVEAFAAGPRVTAEMNSALGEFESLLAETLDVAPPPATGTTHLAAGLVAGVVSTIRKTTLTGRSEELPYVTDELTDWMLSVAHEEVVAFCVSRPRSVNEVVAGRHPTLRTAFSSRESVGDPSRRAIMATARLAAAGGLHGLTSAQIRKDAGLSRREFERHFTGVDDCFLGTVESISTIAGDVAQASAANAETWERWIHKTMSALCSIAAADRDLSRLILIDITAPGRAGLLRREELIGRAAAFVRKKAPPGERPSELRAAASISAVWRIAETEVAARRARELPRITLAFVFMVVASRRSRDRSRPRTVERASRVESIPALSLTPSAA
jgi:AcrR family transcriptional regulator